MIEITRDIAARVLETVDAGLVSGLGDPIPGKMCVEAAVCYALGLPHGDDPGCVAEPLRRLKIRLNDARWSSDQARAKGLRRLALAQLGSAGVLDHKEFRRRVVEMTIRRAVPVALRAAARLNKKSSDELEDAAVRCERDGDRAAAQNAQKVANKARAADADAAAYAAAAADAAAAAYAAADDAYAAYAAYAAADDAAAAAAYAAAAAADAAAAASAAAAAADADAAAYAAAADAAAAAYAAADDAYAAAYAAYAAYAAAASTRDRVLAEYSEWVVEILIEMKAPGCQWLELIAA
jgi:hypothetical protein